MRLSEAIILGNSAFPACRNRWQDGDAGCLITNALRAVGVYAPRLDIPERAHQVWPYLDASFVPAIDPKGRGQCHNLQHWITKSYDNAGRSADEIAAAVRGIEDALGVPLSISATDAPALDRSVMEVTA